MVAVLVEGDWDYKGYVKNTYLPNLEWRILVIKGSNKITRTATPAPDPADYRAVCAYYGIPE